MAFLVIDRAVQSDQGRKSVYVVDDVRKVDGVLVGTVEKRKLPRGRCRSTSAGHLGGTGKNDWVVTGTLQASPRGHQGADRPKAAVVVRPAGNQQEPPKKDDKSKKTPR